MNPKLYWITGPWPGKLAISARPRGGDWLEDEISGWRTAGVDAVVSLLTPDENEDLQLVSEADLAQARGLRFVSLLWKIGVCRPLGTMRRALSRR